jgi:hypothetical protein
VPKNGKIKGELGSKAMHREVEKFEGTHVLREESEVYGFKSPARTMLRSM